jgi:osmotically-inducible protein OsmY
MNLDSAKQMIVEVSRLPEYQSTASSESEFQDLSLAARVHASLASSHEFPGAIFDVHAVNGNVQVSGILQFWISQDHVMRAVKRVPGVNKVTTTLILSRSRRTSLSVCVAMCGYRIAVSL